MLRPGNVEPMIAQLVLAVGSHAGMEAPLHNGYYMIGRHPECQIRPKSRSVSRRHCLLFAQNGEVQVRDLKSSSGTKVNDQRIEGSDWVKLGDGDELRLGKVVFTVHIQQSAEGQGGPGGMVTAEPWQSFDVASMLSSADEEERERRYEQIRGGEDGAEDQGFITADSDSDDFTDTQIEIDDFADAFADDLGSLPSEAESPASPVAAQAAPTSTPNSDKKAKASRPPKPSKPKPLPRAPKKMRRKMSAGGFSGNTDRLKFIGAVVLTLVVISFFGYRMYQFTSGPSVRVIQNID